MSEATEAENREDAERLAKMLRAVAECPKPVVARVQGNAFGGGAGLVACSDIAIASETARFGFTEVRLGLAPATIAPHVIRKIGPGAALPLFLTGERFDAQRAHALGLVHRVVPEDELDSAVDEVVLALLAGSPKAQTAVKELVRRVAVEPGRRDRLRTPRASSPPSARATKAARASPRSSRNESQTGPSNRMETAGMIVRRQI